MIKGCWLVTVMVAPLSGPFGCGDGEYLLAASRGDSTIG